MLFVVVKPGVRQATRDGFRRFAVGESITIETEEGARPLLARGYIRRPDAPAGGVIVTPPTAPEVEAVVPLEHAVDAIAEGKQDA